MRIVIGFDGSESSRDALQDLARAGLPTGAKAWKAHAIFMGSRGLSGFRSLLMGGASSAVAAHAPCTVGIVRPRKGG